MTKRKKGESLGLNKEQLNHLLSLGCIKPSIRLTEQAFRIVLIVLNVCRLGVILNILHGRKFWRDAVQLIHFIFYAVVCNPCMCFLYIYRFQKVMLLLDWNIVEHSFVLENLLHKSRLIHRQ